MYVNHWVFHLLSSNESAYCITELRYWVNIPRYMYFLHHDKPRDTAGAMCSEDLLIAFEVMWIAA